MQFIVSINQTKALEWGLNAQQALLFAYLHQVPTWANSRQIDGVTWFNCGKGKVVEELPILTDKQDTVYRLMKQLREAGLIDMTSTDNKTFIRLTSKGIEWNRAGSENYPTPGKKSDQGRKNIREGSENSPTNQDTNINNPSLSDACEQDEEASPFDRKKHFKPNGVPLTFEPFPMTEDWSPESGNLLDKLSNPVNPRMARKEAEKLLKDHGGEALERFITKHLSSYGQTYDQLVWHRHFADFLVSWHRNLPRQKDQNADNGDRHANRTARNQNRAPIGRLSPAEARRAAEREEREREQWSGAGQVYDGDFQPGH